jgi:hypothetical protein
VGLALLAAAAMVACGSSSKSTTAPVSSAAALRAQTLCTAAGLRLRRLAASEVQARQRRDFASLGRIVSATGGIFRRLARQLQAHAGQPPQRAAILTYASTLADQGQRISALGPAVARRDARVSQSIKRGIDRGSAVLRSQAAAAGLRTCGGA